MVEFPACLSACPPPWEKELKGVHPKDYISSASSSSSSSSPQAEAAAAAEEEEEEEERPFSTAQGKKKEN